MDTREISQDDWELLFGRRDAQMHKSCRAAEVRPSLEVSSEMPRLVQKNNKNVQTVTSKSLCSPIVENPDHLVRHVMLSTEVDFIAVFEFLVLFFESSHKNFKILEDTFSIIGFVFDGTHFAQFRVQIFSHEQQFGVCLHFLDGTAQEAITDFWSKLQDALTENIDEPTTNEDADLTQSDEEFFQDWDDEEDQLFLLPIPTLKSSEPDVIQPTYVNDLMQEMQDQNFMLHALLLLSWNCQLKQNLEVISKSGQAQQLFDLIIACLVATATDFCLPIARSASLLVSKLAETGAVEISEEQFQVLVNTLVQWTIENQNGDFTETVTQSEEIAQLLSSKLPELAKEYSDSECMQQLQEVYCRVPFQSVRQNIAPLVQ